MAQYYRRKDDRETYFVKSDEPALSINQLGFRLTEADTGKNYINIDGVWTPEIISETINSIQSDGTVINLADSYWKDEQVVGSIGDRSLRQGNMFATGYLASSVAQNASIILHIKSGTKPIYITYEVLATALTEYGSYLNPTITTNGTVLTPFKRNQVTAYTGSATAYHTPTYSNIGTIAITRFLGSGVNPVSRIGGSDSTQYAIIPSNTSVFFVAKNVANASQDRMGIYASWFEINGEL
jgi:hypothetical protein